MTLMSNSSFSEHPENKTSSFVVSLPRNITLQGPWEVALAEIIYSQTFENVTPENCTLVATVTAHLNDKPIHSVNVMYTYKVEPGYYTSASQLIQAINNEIQKHHNHVLKKNWLEMDDSSGRVKANTEDLGRVYISEITRRQKLIEGHAFQINLMFTPILALQLGFEPEVAIKTGLAKHPPCLRHGIKPEMLIYCDLIEPQLFSDTYSQVLRTVATMDADDRFGAPCVRSFTIRHYLPLLKTDFKTVEIDIRGSTGGLMPFAWGSSCILLHFRKRQP